MEHLGRQTIGQSRFARDFIGELHLGKTKGGGSRLGKGKPSVHDASDP